MRLIQAASAITLSSLVLTSCSRKPALVVTAKELNGSTLAIGQPIVFTAELIPIRTEVGIVGRAHSAMVSRNVYDIKVGNEETGSATFSWSFMDTPAKGTYTFSAVYIGNEDNTKRPAIARAEILFKNPDPVK